MSATEVWSSEICGVKLQYFHQEHEKSVSMLILAIPIHGLWPATLLKLTTKHDLSIKNFQAALTESKQKYSQRLLLKMEKVALCEVLCCRPGPENIWSKLDKSFRYPYIRI